ncbi:MAG: glycosyltransferase family 39 protein [Pseudomonadota bacterium]
MQSQANPQGARGETLFKIALVIAVGLIIIRGAVTIAQGTGLDAASNDDLMRMMSVRDWMSGQSWFDMTQYRLIPETGVSMHWSRYIDAGIAAILLPVSLVTSQDMAETIAAVAWPSFLAIALICCAGFGARRLMGPIGGAIAAATVVSYPTLVSGYFLPGRVDHHSVQILLMTIACISIALPDQPGRRGIIAGFAAGLSLVVSLETMFLIAAIGAAHVIDFALGRSGGARRLAGFCATLSVSAVVLFLGQTPPAEWTVPYCDEIALPFLAIACIGSLAGMASLLLPSNLRRPWSILGVVGGVTALGFFVSWPLIGGCVQSPYGNLPEETQNFISNTIMEALPLVAFAQRLPDLAVNTFAMAIVAVGGATCLYLWELRIQKVRPGLIHLLVFAWIGLLASVWQVRQVIIVAAVVPFVLAYFVQYFIDRRLEQPSSSTQMAMYGVLAITLFLPTLVAGVSEVQAAIPGADEPQTNWTNKDDSCNELARLSNLNAIAPSTILTSINVGPALIYATHHAALSAPYHRSNDAIVNGNAFALIDDTAFSRALKEMGARHLIVCENSRYGTEESIGSRLAAGEPVPGYARIDLGGPNLMLFEVVETP